MGCQDHQEEPNIYYAMSEKEDILKELQDIAPELARFKEEQVGTGFQVPPRYFRDLTQVVMNEVREDLQDQTSTLTKPSGWWQDLLASIQNLIQPKPALALAFIGLLLAVGFWFGQSNTALDTVNPNFAMNNDDLEAYVLANIDDFETDLLMDMYAETFPEEEEQITEENLDELLQEMDDEDFEDLWDAETFKE